MASFRAFGERSVSWLGRPTSMLTASNARIAWLIFIVSFCIRIPFLAIPPATGLDDVDELILALSVVDRWLGLPPQHLVWPAMLSRFIGTAIMAPQMLWALARDRSLDRYGQALYHFYADPAAIILGLRVVSALAMAAAAVAAYRLVETLTRDRRVALLAAAVINVLPLCMQYSLDAKGDAIGFACAIWAAYFALAVPRRPVLVGLLTAAAVANRTVTVAWLLPVFAVAAEQVWRGDGWRRLTADAARCAVAGTAGLVLFFPYLWLDPLRAIKAVLGTVMAQAVGWVPGYDVLGVPISGSATMFVLIAAALLGALVGLRDKRYRISAAVLGLFIALLLGWLVMHGFLSWRYVIGATIPFLALASIYFESGASRASLSVLTVAVAGLAVVSLYDQVQQRRGPSYRDTDRAIAAFCRAGDTIWLDGALVAGMPRLPPMPTATLEDVAAYFEHGDRGGAIRRWLAEAGVAPRAATALQTSFNESEQTETARWRLLAAYSRSPLNCAFHLFRTSSRGGDFAQPGYVRGTLTDKTLTDVQADLADQTAGRVIRVIGLAGTLAPLGLPQVRLSPSAVVVTRRQSKTAP